MATSGSLTIQGSHVQTLYTDYINNKFIVNRKYQRKLVWSIEEKRNFIDTLYRELPIPLFLVAEVDINNNKKLEIIDGMQRLDAIFSFIEQKYSLKDGYFDLSTMADSQEMVEKNILKQHEPILEKSFCRKIVNYLIPLSKSTSLDNKGIEEAFRRINSNGRHLSNQELRQAGMLGKFSEIVRQLATDIRKDVSDDILPLNEMSKISISQRRLGNYGINVNNIFWVKNNIIQPYHIRNSIDEELIAFLIADMILRKKENLTAKMLNSYYGFSSNPLASEPVEKTTIENSIDRVSPEIIKKQFRAVFSLIQNILENSGKDFKSLLFEKSSGVYLRDVFHVIFMSIYTLIVTEGKKNNNLNRLSQQLLGIGDDLFTEEQVKNIYRCDKREKMIKSVVGIINDSFIKKEVDDVAYDDWTMNFDNILMKSKSEQNSYDFKIGLSNLETGHFNEKLLLKIAKTITAISNLGLRKKGYVIVGVTDTKEDANKYKAFYKCDVTEMHDFYITGIESEAIKISGNIDKYLHKVKDVIKNSPIKPESVKSNILTKMISRNYYGKEILIFEIEGAAQPSWYDGKIYERHMSHNEEVPLDAHQSVYSRFYPTNSTENRE
ncbi:DUF262 domain-containing protein [Methylovulum psychrotolerans]|uniref:DUF262 domain-containing protein n=1 Tax=Methylovulum psychrotolerans TaxID=1704499 RepID=UPI001BFF1B9A|nr:DUF262 domain-containing protein [Methylovulum psychrotolerans]MBT9096680.1 DUF262 domain-containing protein [Methylovulum psychrotolerans]